MSDSSNDPFDFSAYLPKSARAAAWHSVERDGESRRPYPLKGTPERAQLRASVTAFLAAGLLAHVLGTMPLGTELVSAAQAQTVPKSLEQGGTDAALKQRKNAWTVGVAGGQLSGTYMSLGDELAQVLDDGDNLRVIPIVTYGAASNLDDLLYLRHVDVVMTQSDVFEYFRTQRKTPNLEKRIHYILRLPPSEMHVLARTDVKSIEDLRGKKVSFGPPGSASSLTGTIVFQRLGVQVEQVLLDNPTALENLKSGELAALVRVIGKPVGFFAQIPANSGLHLLPIPFFNVFDDHYTLGAFTSEEYPTLVPQGETIDTIAVPAVLAVFNWPKDTDRYRRVKRFTEALFTKWDKFHEPHRHPKWRDVNLAATVPGWTRSNVAQEMLTRLQQKEPTVAELNFHSSGLRDLTEGQRKDLFDEYLKWRQGSSEKQQGSGVKRQGTSAQQRGSSTKQQGSSAKQQASSAKQQGSSAKQQGSSAKQQGSGAKQQASSAKQQGSGAKQQGSSAKQQGSGAKQQGSSAKQQGSSAKQQGSSAKQQGTSIQQQWNSVQR
jgi:TRAP transporter TAXI family solute receptor